MRNALVLLPCPWEHVQPMGYLTFVMCACNGLENEEVTGSSEEQVETDDSEEEVEDDDCEDYDLTDSTKQEVKDMGYEHNDTLNCRTYV